MKLEITDACTGHGRCYMSAPELFEIDDDTGYGTVKNRGQVPTGLQAAARSAVPECPEGAIQLEESS